MLFQGISVPQAVKSLSPPLQWRHNERDGVSNQRRGGGENSLKMNCNRLKDKVYIKPREINPKGNSHIPWDVLKVGRK